ADGKVVAPLLKNSLILELSTNGNLSTEVEHREKNQSCFLTSLDVKRNMSHKSDLRNPYKFNLLYRASRDGDTPAAFHQKCDNKGANVVIIKINGTEQIVGGYNPFGWEGNNQWKSTDKSFIFSFVIEQTLILHK
ncbi:20427_t:CDS:2, partial [Funneliformis geosporum]